MYICRNNKNMKISFDFDGTLAEPEIQDIAKMLISSGADVWIVTARFDDNVLDHEGKRIGYLGHNYYIREVAKYLGIPKDKIIYTCGHLKVDVYFKEKFDYHYDDMLEEVNAINEKGGNAFLVGATKNNINRSIYGDF